MLNTRILMERPKYYLNPAQQDFLTVGARDNYIIGSRGVGKSDGIDSMSLLRYVTSMPGSTGGLLSPTYKKLRQNTLKAIITGLRRYGLKRDVHYVIGKKPDKRLGFLPNKQEIIDYENLIYFWTGSVAVMISLDGPMSANSMNLDWICAFEARYLNFTKVTEEVVPAVRGGREYFGNCAWHHGKTFTTDMPQLKSESWILEKEKECDPALINMIRTIHRKAKEMKEKESTYSPSYYDRKMKEYRTMIRQFRSAATYFAEYDVFWNLEILGERYIADKKRELTPHSFMRQIGNRRPGRVENGFYSALNINHYYEKSNHSYLHTLDYEDVPHDCRADGDLDPSKYLVIANDYNSAINWLVVGQVYARELRTVNKFYVKTPRKLKDVVEEFCDYYDPFPRKEVVYYYDTTATPESAATDETFADIVIKLLRKRGWKVKAINIGQPMKHHKKHLMIDRALKGDPEFRMPTFNKDNTYELLVAMENAGVRVNKNGFEKDKSAEKKPDSELEPDQYKTHGTDAWDTMFIGVHTHPVRVFSTISVSTRIV